MPTNADLSLLRKPLNPLRVSCARIPVLPELPRVESSQPCDTTCTQEKKNHKPRRRGPSNKRTPRTQSKVGQPSEEADLRPPPKSPRVSSTNQSGTLLPAIEPASARSQPTQPTVRATEKSNRRRGFGKKRTPSERQLPRASGNPNQC